MKMKLFILFMGCLLFTFLSCEEGDLEGTGPKYQYDVKHVETIPIQLNGTNGDWMSFMFKNTLTINDDQVKYYSTKIKEVQINKLTYKIINFKGDPLGEVKGSFSVANKVCLENSLKVKSSADNEIIYEVTAHEEINRICQALKSNQTVNVVYSGSALCNEIGMDFIVEVTLDTKVIVQL